jgi:hypothetical protein
MYTIICKFAPTADSDSQQLSLDTADNIETAIKQMEKDIAHQCKKLSKKGHTFSITR